MPRKFMVLFVSIVLAFCFAGCGGDDDASAADLCNDSCNKTYDECGEEYAEEWDVDEDDLEDLLDDCLELCEPNEDAEACSSCYEDAYSEADVDECWFEISYDSYNECLMDLDCEDYVTSDGCEDEYDDAYSEYEDAVEECEDAQADLSEDELADLYDALNECYESDECEYLTE